MQLYQFITPFEDDASFDLYDDGALPEMPVAEGDIVIVKHESAPSQFGRVLTVDVEENEAFVRVGHERYWIGIEDCEFYSFGDGAAW